MKTIIVILAGIVFGVYASLGAGIVPTTGAYEVAAYFNDAKYAFWDSVKWTEVEVHAGVPVLKQMYLLVQPDGEIRYLEFASRSPDGPSGVLCTSLFVNEFSHGCTVEKEALVGLRIALQRLTSIETLPSRLAGTRDKVSISTPGSPSVAYSEPELNSWNDGFMELRVAMQRMVTKSEISAICRKYWGAEKGQVRNGPKLTPED